MRQVEDHEQDFSLLTDGLLSFPRVESVSHRLVFIRVHVSRDNVMLYDVIAMT